MREQETNPVRQETSAWTALDGQWYYLGRKVDGGYEIATLRSGPGDGRREEERQRPMAPAFTSKVSARPFTTAAPAGVELLAVAAHDLRAKEEWLRAVIEQGVATLVFDPPQADLHAALESNAALPVHTALGYILSQRRATACL